MFDGIFPVAIEADHWEAAAKAARQLARQLRKLDNLQESIAALRGQLRALAPAVMPIAAELPAELPELPAELPAAPPGAPPAELPELPAELPAAPAPAVPAKPRKAPGMNAAAFWTAHAAAVEACRQVNGADWWKSAGDTIGASLPVRWRSMIGRLGGRITWRRDWRMPAAKYWRDGFPAELIVAPPHVAFPPMADMSEVIADQIVKDRALRAAAALLRTQRDSEAFSPEFPRMLMTPAQQRHEDWVARCEAAAA